MTLSRSLPTRPILAVLLGAAFVMVPAGIIYSASFIALNAILPAAEFTQASPSEGALAWRIISCLLCAVVAGCLSQTLSKDRSSFAVGALAGVCLLCGLLGIHSSGLYHDANTPMRLILAIVLAVVIYASGRITALRTT